jgi:PAS domain S-box-containing protein
MIFSASRPQFGYLVAVFSTLLALVLSLWLDPLVSHTVVTFFYLAVAISAWYGGFWPGFTSTAISVLSLHHFLIHDRQLFSVTAILMSFFADNLRCSRDQLRASRDQVIGLNQQAAVDFETLQVSEWRWRTLFDNVQMSVIGIGLLGQIEYMNSHFLNITGHDPLAIVGRDAVQVLFRPQDEVQIRRDFRELIAKGLSYTYECIILTTAGVELSTTWYSTIMRNPAGQIMGIMSIGEDITQRLALEKAKNEFISVVSHELRTPLTGIRGSLGLLAAGIYDNKPEKSRRMIQVASEQTDRLVRLVNDILDLERLDAGQTPLWMEACVVGDLISQSVDTMRSQADQSQITMAVVPDPHLQVWAAPDAIIQTLTNLLSNAIKFSLPGGVVRVMAELVDRQVVFSIQDQGRGIPADKLEAIFGRFQQVDSSDARQKGGTGLGLAICRQIIQQHHGRLWVKSEIDRGSTFHFTLPAFSPSCPIKEF